MGDFCHLQLLCYDMPIICQHPSSRTAHELFTIKINYSNAFISACWIWVLCRRPDVRIKNGFGVCFILVASLSKQLMLLFRSPHKPKTTLKHNMLEYVLDNFNVLFYNMFVLLYILLLLLIFMVYASKYTK